MPGKTLIFKAALYRFGTVATEAWVFDRIRERGVPAPRVLVTDATCTLFPTPYMILEQVPGTPLRDNPLRGALRESLLRHGGELLRRVHSVHVDGYGLFDEDLYVRTGQVKGLHDTWRPTALRRLHWGLPYLERHELLDRREITDIHHLLDQHGTVLDTRWPGRLLHGDFQNRHVYIDLSIPRITGLIDFGNREAGDVAWDLARFALREGDNDLRSLLDGYSTDSSEREAMQRRIPFYRFLHSFSDVRKFHMRGQTQQAKEGLREIRFFLNSERRVASLNDGG